MLPQRFPLDVWHHVVDECRSVACRDLAGIVERDDVGMVEAGRDLDLAEEALRAERWELRLEDLDRHAPVMLEVLRQINGGHAAAAHFARCPRAAWVQANISLSARYPSRLSRDVRGGSADFPARPLAERLSHQRAQ